MVFLAENTLCQLYLQVHIGSCCWWCVYYFIISLGIVSFGVFFFFFFLFCFFVSEWSEHFAYQLSLHVQQFIHH